MSAGTVKYIKQFERARIISHYTGDRVPNDSLSKFSL